MSDWTEELRRRRKKEHDESKAKLYEMLGRRPEIVKVEITYDGSGDEGNIEAITAYYSVGKKMRRAKLDRDEERIIEDYLYDALPPGWEDSEGSFGTCTIDVPTKKAHFDHQRYVVSAEEDPFED